MGLFGDFSGSSVGQNLLGSSPQQQRNTLLNISQAFAAPKNRGETTMGNVLGAVTQSSATRQKDSEQRMGQVLSAMPKGMNFKNISPESKSMIEDYLRTGDQTLLMNIDFGTASTKGKITDGMLDKFTTKSMKDFGQTGDHSKLVRVGEDAEGSGKLGTYDPSDYTIDSYSNFVVSKNPADLKRYVAPKGLSSTAEGALFGAIEEANSASQSAVEMEDLAKRFEEVKPVAGILGQANEAFKKMLGSEEEVSSLRTKWSGIRSSSAVKNLPPGTASDSDVQLVLSGFPDPTANSEYIASFLRGMAKLERLNADYHTSFSDYLSDKGTIKGFKFSPSSGVGIDKPTERVWNKAKGAFD